MTETRHLSRGQVWWARVDKRRPVLLLSPDAHYAARTRVLAAEVTTRLRHNRATVAIGPADGMPARCIVNLDNLVTVDRADLVERVTTLNAQRLREICRALAFATGCE